jgi:hypothetical protein
MASEPASEHGGYLVHQYRMFARYCRYKLARAHNCNLSAIVRIDRLDQYAAIRQHG